jgi:hypothetical protein
MKACQLIFSLVFVLVMASCQAEILGPKIGTASKRNMTPEEFRVSTIEYLMAGPSPLKKGSVQLHRMGDHAATYILQVLQTRGNRISDAERHTVLDMIRKAYERPAAIASVANRGTLSSMILLQRLEASTDDATVKQRVPQVRKFIQHVR